MVGDWQRALRNGQFADEIALWVPSSEAMILGAYGRVDARHLFDGAARVADLQDRQMTAVRAALAMPALLFATLAVMLWGAGGYFMPVLGDLVPADEWPVVATLFRDASLALYRYPLVFCLALATLAGSVVVIMLTWTGPLRPLLDSVAPFSLYRTVVGSAFLFVLLEYLKAGVDLNSRTFDDLKRQASPYTRHRITAIQDRMTRGPWPGRQHDRGRSRVSRSVAGPGGSGTGRHPGLGVEARLLCRPLDPPLGSAAEGTHGHSQRPSSPDRHPHRRWRHPVPVCRHGRRGACRQRQFLDPSPSEDIHDPIP